MKNNILELITAYRKTVLMLAVYRIGLFEIVRSKPLETEQIAAKLNINRELLDILLDTLNEMGMIAKVSSGWHASINMDGFRSLFEFEQSLYDKFITPDYLIESLKSVTDGRPFDKDGFSLKEAANYFQFMNGRNLNLLVLLISREIGKKTDLNYLEFGRSLGSLGVHFQKIFKNLSVDIVFDMQYIQIFEEQVKAEYKAIVPKIHHNTYDIVEQSHYGLICVYNTIHYYKAVELLEELNKFRKCLADGGLLCIIDIFLDERPLNHLITLDWITHGGIYYLKLQELENLLSQAGLTIVKSVYNAETSMHILYVLRS